jgi:rhodanese-related sulfurtransferase
MTSRRLSRPQTRPSPVPGPPFRAGEALGQAGLLFLFSFLFAVVFDLFYTYGIELRVSPALTSVIPSRVEGPVSFTGWNSPSKSPGAAHGAPSARPAASAPSATDDIVLVSLEGVKGWFDQKSAVFLDARPPEEYQEGHIPGALEFYADDFDRFAPQVLPQLPEKDRKIVCYCHGSSCELSITLAHRLMDLGYTNVKVFFGGWPQWKGAGYPIDKGDTP